MDKALAGIRDQKGLKGVTAGKLTWRAGPYGKKEFSFSMRNRLRENVKNVHYYVIFYDELGDPIDVIETWFTTQIPAGLAKRVKYPDRNPYIKYPDGVLDFGFLGLGVDNDVYELTKRVEFRILDFEIAR